jgi:hypothetical protein
VSRIGLHHTYFAEVTCGAIRLKFLKRHRAATFAATGLAERGQIF